MQNFTDLARLVPEFGRFAVNSLFVSSTIVCVQLFFSSLAGFALAKYDFKGKSLVMVIMLATMMIPGQVTMAPLYELLCRLRLVDTYPGLIVPGAGHSVQSRAVSDIGRRAVTSFLLGS